MAENVVLDDITSLGLGSALTKLNGNFTKVANEFDKVLYKNGRAAWTANQDANGKRLINLPYPIYAQEPIRLGDVGLLAKGDPGGNVMSVGLFVGLAGVNMPAGTDIIQTAGFHTLGKGVARYSRWTAPMTALPAWGQGYWWFQALDGSRWQLAERVVTSDMFGTRGDAVRAYLSQTVTGTDVTTILNTLTYYAQYNGLGTVYLSQGSHRTSDTIHVGTGEGGFQGVRLVGVGEHNWGTRWDNQINFPSAEIKAEKNDRPAINIQGARGSAVINVAIEGPLAAFILQNGLGRSDGGLTINDVNRSAWLPGTGAHTNGQYNPGAGIAIDAFSGVAPAGAYPAVGYISGAAQYGKNFSSEILLHGVRIFGFSAGIVSQPCNADGNGDFIKISDSTITECINAVSIGNSQSRNVEIRNVQFANVHTFMTNNQHGKKTGKFGGPIDNVSGGQSLQIFDLNMGVAGPINITNFYCEGMWRLGDANGVGLINFHGEIEMRSSAGTNGTFPQRGIPRTHFGTSAFPSGANGGGLTDTKIILSGAIRTPYCLVLASTNADTRDLQPLTIHDGTVAIPTWEAQGHNALAGGIMAYYAPYSRFNHRIGSRFLLMDTNTGLGLSSCAWDGETFKNPRRNTGCPIFAKFVTCQTNDSKVTVPREYIGYDHSQLTSKTLTGKTFTFTIAGGGTAKDKNNLSPGDILFHSASSSVFIISARSGDNFTAILQNGFLDTAGTYTYPNGAPTLTEGTYYTLSGRYYMPDDIAFGDTTSGSGVVTNVFRADGTFPNTADFADGDAIAFNPNEDFGWPIYATISSRDSTAKTITLSSAANATVTRRRLIFKKATS